MTARLRDDWHPGRRQFNFNCRYCRLQISGCCGIRQMTDANYRICRIAQSPRQAVCHDFLRIFSLNFAPSTPSGRQTAVKVFCWRIRLQQTVSSPWISLLSARHHAPGYAWQNVLRALQQGFHPAPDLTPDKAIPERYSAPAGATAAHFFPGSFSEYSGSDTTKRPVFPWRFICFPGPGADADEAQTRYGPEAFLRNRIRKKSISSLSVLISTPPILDTVSTTVRTFFLTGNRHDRFKVTFHTCGRFVMNQGRARLFPDRFPTLL